MLLTSRAASLALTARSLDDRLLGGPGGTLGALMSDKEPSGAVLGFATHYTTHQRELIRFAWNGKHSADFLDENQEFRASIARIILSEPDSVPIVLVRDILLEDALWSREAWCAPHHFAGLLSILLQRGGREYLIDFAVAMNATFDTFGAAHEIALSPRSAHELLEDTELHLLVETDARRRSELQGARELFRKVIEGKATDGWVTVAPGTPVKNIRVLGRAPQPALVCDSARARIRALRDRLVRFFRRGVQ